MKSDHQVYSTFSKFLHWSMAIIIISMLAFGFFMDDMSKAVKPTVYMLHKSFGLLILFLIVVRAIWNGIKGVPKLPDSMAPHEKRLAQGAHHMLYLLVFLMPLAGLIMSVAARRLPSFFDLFTVTIPGIPHSKPLAGFMSNAHTTIAWVLIVMLVLHIAAAVFHKVVRKDGVFERMAGINKG